MIAGQSAAAFRQQSRWLRAAAGSSWDPLLFQQQAAGDEYWWS